MKTQALSKNDTAILKGIGILLIVLHNFLHWTEPFNSRENEFYFKDSNVSDFFSSIAGNPFEFVNIFLSYFGSYGVQIFIFLSGYGLYLSFKNRPAPWFRFVVGRAAKLWCLLVVALIIQLVTNVLTYQTIDAKLMLSFLYKFLFVHILIPGEGMSYNGPLWFVGCIMQLYILFPFIYRMMEKYGLKAFLIICAFSYSIIYLSVYGIFSPNNVFILQNFPGHLPEFCLGVLLAQKSGMEIKRIYLFTSIVVFFAGAFLKPLFPFAFIAFSFMVFCLYQMVQRSDNDGFFGRMFAYFGGISMLLFATHGNIRWTFVVLTQKHDNAAMTLLIAVAFVASAVLVAKSVSGIYDKLNGFVKDKTK